MSKQNKNRNKTKKRITNERNQWEKRIKQNEINTLKTNEINNRREKKLLLKTATGNKLETNRQANWWPCVEWMEREGEKEERWKCLYVEGKRIKWSDIDSNGCALSQR